MTSQRVGVAISTTGADHRMALLRECVGHWDRALTGLGFGSLFVTVDGSADDAERVRQAVFDWTGSVYRIGQLDTGLKYRLGVAANKNTGLELLMENTPSEHLFLSDDDTWPRFPHALAKHMSLPAPHSMVCWGHHRLDPASHGEYATWTWPRGVMLYMSRAVVERVGGMDERFGLGGHEHAEYSMRIHNAGFTPSPFVSPGSYGTRKAMGADALWYAEDMPRLGEARHEFARRKRRHTTISDTDRDWEQINRIMAERDGSADFVPYRAAENGRASATLCSSNTSLGAEK